MCVCFHAQEFHRGLTSLKQQREERKNRHKNKSEIHVVEGATKRKEKPNQTVNKTELKRYFFR